MVLAQSDIIAIPALSPDWFIGHLVYEPMEFALQDRTVSTGLTIFLLDRFDNDRYG